MNLIFIFIFCIIIIFLICNNCVFPLSSGNLNSGIESIKNISKYNINNNDTFNLAAVIIEPRNNNLIFIIDHYLKILPEDTPILIYHGLDNYKNLFFKYFNLIKSKKIFLINLGVKNLSILSYSYILTHSDFWNSIPSENILIFQTDTITCSSSLYDITNFFNYDFIGAPCPSLINFLIKLKFFFQGIFVFNTNFYNGGLSFRKKSSMLKVIKFYPWDKLSTEDIWFCAHIPKIGGILPSLEEARKFSFEAESFNYIPWGLHKPRKDFDKLDKICPLYKYIPHPKAHTDYKNLFLL